MAHRSTVRRGLSLVLGTLLLSACHRLPPPALSASDLPRTRRFEEGSATFRIEYLPIDAEAAADVEEALRAAARQVTRWAGFEAPIVVRLYPTHDALEEAVGRIDYPWLRAWARYDEIFLQSPRTYGPFEGGRRNLTELLTHELTHCLMYQQAGSRANWLWRDRQIPIWFREGMASWTARQGHRRMSEARLAAWVEANRMDPIREAERLYQREADAVYSAAHWAFTFLMDRYGAEAVRRLLASLEGGTSFDSAFQAAVGLPRRDFETEFLRYRRWEGWVDRRHRPVSSVLTPSRVERAPADAPPPVAAAATPPR